MLSNLILYTLLILWLTSAFAMVVFKSFACVTNLFISAGDTNLLSPAFLLAIRTLCLRPSSTAFFAAFWFFDKDDPLLNVALPSGTFLISPLNASIALSLFVKYLVFNSPCFLRNFCITFGSVGPSLLFLH